MTFRTLSTDFKIIKDKRIDLIQPVKWMRVLKSDLSKNKYKVQNVHQSAVEEA